MAALAEDLSLSRHAPPTATKSFPVQHAIATAEVGSFVVMESAGGRQTWVPIVFSGIVRHRDGMAVQGPDVVCSSLQVAQFEQCGECACRKVKGHHSMSVYVRQPSRSRQGRADKMLHT